MKIIQQPSGKRLHSYRNSPFIVDLPSKHGDLPIKNCDLPIRKGDLPIKNCDLPIKNGDLPIKSTISMGYFQ